MAIPKPSELLPRSRRNEVLSILKDCGLGPFLHLFEWRDVIQRVRSVPHFFDRNTLEIAEIARSSPVSKLECKDGSALYYFLFSGVGSPIDIAFFPDANLGPSIRTHVAWNKVLEHVREWASAMASEMNARDLWAEIDSESVRSFQAATSATGADSPFQEGQVAQIREAATTFHRELLSRYDVPPNVAAEIKSRIDDMVSAAQRQTRTAWMQTAVGHIVSIALSISPQVGLATSLLALFGHLLISREILRLPVRGSERK